MSRGTGGPFDPDALLRDFRLYDRNVDIVSAYQWAFAQIREVAPTVEHFERYPKMTHPDGRDVTPDFTVQFNDGRAIVAEIANIALRDESVDSLCRQLGRYASLDGVPGHDGRVNKATVVDVMFLTPMDTAADAAKRLFVDRLDSDNHPYSPRRRPVLVQYARTEDHYVFQRWPDDAVNGALQVGDVPFGPFPNLKLKPDRFAGVKVKYGFMNDPVKPLYMATRLWASVFPSRFWVDEAKNEFSATTAEIASVVQELYGRGRPSDVKAAMFILVSAGLAVPNGAEWVVARRALKLDVPNAIVDRISKAGSGRAVGQRPRSSAPQESPFTLF